MAGLQANTSPAKTASKPGPLERRAEIIKWEENAYNHLPPLPSTLEEFWTEIVIPDGFRSRTLVVRPRSTASSTTDIKRPLIVHFHGGGMAAGTPSMLVHPARLFAERFNATVVCPSYRFAPENVWPKPHESAISVVQTIAGNLEYQYGANPEDGFILGGLSAGGTLACVIAGLTSSQPTTYPLKHKITGVFLGIAFIFTDDIVPSEYKSIWTSRADNRYGEIFSTKDMDDVLETLQCTDNTSPWFSAANISTDPSQQPNLCNHPPTYLAGCALDPLRDDPVVYEKMLAKAGVATKLHVFTDDNHQALTTFNLIYPTKSKDPTIEEGTLEGVGWLLGQ